MNNVYEISVIALAIGALITVSLIIFLVYKNKINKLRKPISFVEDDIQIPILASFTGLKFLPAIISLAHNNFNPSLRLFKDHIECKVIFTQHAKYSDIENIDIFIGPLTKNIRVRFTNSAFTFSANIFDENNLKKTLKFFADKKCRLSIEAKRLCYT